MSPKAKAAAAAAAQVNAVVQTMQKKDGNGTVLPPNGNGMKKVADVLPVPGYEAQVATYLLRAETLKWVKDEVDGLKEMFRRAATTIALQVAPGVTGLSFEGGDGRAVAVSLPDLTKDGNRTRTEAASIQSFLDRGLDMNSYLEREVTFTLQDEFATWMTGLLAQWNTQGVAIPAGLTSKETVRLSAAGAAALRQLAIGGNAVAAEALETLTKAPSIRSK